MSYSLINLIYCLILINIEINPPEIQNDITSALEYAYIEQFDSAQIYLDKVIKIHPDNPAGFFFKAALLQLRMMDQCQYNDEKDYLMLLKQAIKLAKNILEKEENLWAEFYLGSSYTYRAVYEGIRNDYFETFRYGTKGGRILQGIIKKDSTFYDAYLGAGSFEYFWARAARYLPVLKLTGGNTEEAIRKLRVASQNSMYSNRTAQNSLVFIYSEENDFTAADSLISILLTTYPESKTFRWNKSDLDYKKKDFHSALETYHNLLSQYEIEENKNFSNIAQCKLAIGKCFYELGEKEEAREALKDVIRLKKHSDKYPLIDGYCREAYSLLSRIF